MPELLQIVFSGALTGEYDLKTSKKNFQKLFRLSDAKVNKLFTGKEIVIKSGMNEQEAMNFAIKIADTGCECAIAEVPDKNDPTNDPDFVDRRKGERRIRTRRPPRPGAIVPDRRISLGRRRGDANKTKQQIG
ncbi:MAG: hypothetical protein JKY88_08260 [Pseudomonadales bacterium]|nr:hypothetical protein [Pseudomonadales bacterium]